MRIAENITQLVGRTPLIQLNTIPALEGVVAQIVVKLEGMNPTASVKDRISISMVEVAESEGLIEPDKTILVDGKDCNRCFLICYQEPVHFGWMALNVQKGVAGLSGKRFL
jgi:hypothetical protein